ncbi:PAQR family membrane homeostasis protein TrhA [Tessaracoccus defluvii]|uniref:Hemolysin III family protein n=1 Tax=Tessaracoccus defluvii TaxID=1285901 RepID=A0A7H0H272_9ACTN|nr:hemolysin III family protein [Tessaracoccus defluvii]QNP54638.1 hemolysin III family protein [Tessaracoccus defluvii]
MTAATMTLEPTISLPAKPKLRGWLHLGMAPVALIVGLVFTVFAPTLEGRIGSGIYTLSAVILFGTSAAYHRGNWTDRGNAIFRRIDHSNIFIFIAGSYTPLTLTLLEGTPRWTLLILIWSIALLGVVFRTTWLSAPRWLYTCLYIAMGWAAVGWMNQFWATGGPAVVVPLLLGGLVYSLGAVAYATKRPRLSPKWFSFHEVFHACTIIAAILHIAAIGIAVFGA